MCMQIFIKVFNMVQEVGPAFSDDLDFDKASTDDKWHLAIPWARFCQYQCVCNILSKYYTRFKSKGQLYLF